MKSLLLAASVFCLASGAALAQQPRSIVGHWYLEPSDCGMQFAYKIEPMGIYQDELQCEFDSVSRSGNTVRWKGRCNNSNYDMVKETVVATETNGVLSLRFEIGGGTLGNLKRCPRR